MRTSRASRWTSPTAIVVILALASTLLSALPATAKPNRCSGARAGNYEYYTLHTLYIELEMRENEYEVGETARMDMTVTRSYEGDVTGQGVPLGVPYSEPAADVQVGAGVRVGDVFLFGFGQTDANGKATVSVPIKNYVKPGPANVDVFAQKVVLETTCLTIVEVGYGSYPKAFKVVD